MQVTVVLLYKGVWFTNEYLYRGKDKKKKMCHVLILMLFQNCMIF